MNIFKPIGWSVKLLLIIYYYSREYTNDPGWMSKYVGNRAGFIYSLRDVEC